MLLPIDEPLDEDELDPRDELVRRLIEYKQFKEAAGTLREKEEERSLLYERGQTPVDVDAGPLPLRPVNLFDLLDALDRVLTPHAGEERRREWSARCTISRTRWRSSPGR